MNAPTSRDIRSLRSEPYAIRSLVAAEATGTLNSMRSFSRSRSCRTIAQRSRITDRCPGLRLASTDEKTPHIETCGVFFKELSDAIGPRSDSLLAAASH